MRRAGEGKRHDHDRQLAVLEPGHGGARQLLAARAHPSGDHENLRVGHHDPRFPADAARCVVPVL
jgi:hypothetical protein